LEAAELKVVTGPDKGLKVTLGADTLTLGSSSQCDVVLHDSTVSARHAEIAASPPGYLLSDLGSTNGVRVGSLVVERLHLTDGLRFSLGESTMTVRALGQRREIPLSRSGEYAGIIAHSVKMRALWATLEQLALSDVTVLIEGETGTGKEVVAQALHQKSPRCRGPFVVFDCGSAQPALAGAELFGHERGAFSGADRRREGLLEAADGGTLFLDELGELPLQLQPLLLGAIERKASRPIGATRDVSHDVRILAATNRNLAEEVREGRFRQDLFFRVAVSRLRLPPLRERSEDIPLLARRFAREAGIALSADVLDLFRRHSWPGNVRELRNTVTRMAAAPTEEANIPAAQKISKAFLYNEEGGVRELPEARRLSIETFERNYLEEVIDLAGGQLKRAAELAGVSGRFFMRLTARYGLRVRDRDGAD
jgi:DNA-binding NtrC family response regulator